MSVQFYGYEFGVIAVFHCSIIMHFFFLLGTLHLCVNKIAIVFALVYGSSVASFLVLGGGGQDPQMYRKKCACNLYARAPQPSGLKIHLHAYKINVVAFYYLWYSDVNDSISTQY